MDAIDRQIIAALEREGRLSVADLAARVQLTAAPCSRRLRELERSGVIVGYRAVVDRAHPQADRRQRRRQVGIARLPRPLRLRLDQHELRHCLGSAPGATISKPRSQPISRNAESTAACLLRRWR